MLLMEENKAILMNSIVIFMRWTEWFTDSQKHEKARKFNYFVKKNTVLSWLIFFFSTASRNKIFQQAERVRI